MPNKKSFEVPTLWVNARFLDRPISGVERVAREVLRSLRIHHLNARGWLDTPAGPMAVKLIAPKTTTPSRDTMGYPLVRAGRFSGHLWEQLDLPRLTAGDWLLSLCNTGPVLKAKHWVFLHDAQPFALPEIFKPSIRFTYPLLYRCLAARAKTVFVNSEFTKRELARYLKQPKTQIEVCPLGSEHALRGRTGKPGVLIPGEPYVLAFASPNPNKNSKAIKQALDLLGDDAPLCVTVGGTGRSVFATNGVNDKRFRHLGHVAESDLVTLYRNALALVYPSKYEGFGLPPLEAMRNNCPVIAANTGALPETVGGGGLYCDPNNPATLANAIQRITKSSALRLTMQHYGAQRAERFSWRRCTDALVKSMLAELQPAQFPAGNTAAIQTSSQ